MKSYGLNFTMIRSALYFVGQMVVWTGILAIGVANAAKTTIPGAPLRPAGVQDCLEYDRTLAEVRRAAAKRLLDGVKPTGLGVQQVCGRSETEFRSWVPWREWQCQFDAYAKDQKRLCRERVDQFQNDNRTNSRGQTGSQVEDRLMVKSTLAYAKQQAAVTKTSLSDYLSTKSKNNDIKAFHALAGNAMNWRQRVDTAQQMMALLDKRSSADAKAKIAAKLLREDLLPAGLKENPVAVFMMGLAGTVIQQHFDTLMAELDYEIAKFDKAAYAEMVIEPNPYYKSAYSAEVKLAAQMAPFDTDISFMGKSVSMNEFARIADAERREREAQQREYEAQQAYAAQQAEWARQAQQNAYAAETARRQREAAAAAQRNRAYSAPSYDDDEEENDDVSSSTGGGRSWASRVGEELGKAWAQKELQRQQRRNTATSSSPPAGSGTDPCPGGGNPYYKYGKMTCRHVNQ